MSTLGQLNSPDSRAALLSNGEKTQKSQIAFFSLHHCSNTSLEALLAIPPSHGLHERQKDVVRMETVVFFLYFSIA